MTATLKLFPDPPPDAQTVILHLLGVVHGFETGDRGYMSLVIDGVQHTPKCPFGQYLRPDDRLTRGSPCSERCRTAREAVSLAVQWLHANRDAESCPAVEERRARRRGA